jgi:hypothetical protein
MKLESKVKAVKKEKSFGHLNIKSGDAPFLADASIDDVVELTVSLKVKELRAADNWDISEKRMNVGDITVSGSIVKISEKSKSVDKS